ncbi:MAG TPA: tryptophan 7-halogenase, partial [Vicinamibacteria bacterium]|nr:tryptophan 7-halogenase [Vicinamibacteria bacterium]
LTGFQVLRSNLEDLLLGHAAASGVDVRHDLRVRDVRFEEEPEAARVEVESPDGRREELRARRVLDASGRAGVVARRGFRRRDGPVTLALAAVWRQDRGFAVADDSHTLVEAYADGWAWSVPVAPGVRHVTVMIDPPGPKGARRDLSSLYSTEFEKAEHLSAILAGGVSMGSSWAADASTYGASTYEGPRLLLVGDAGSFIDPLSSFGVKKALASAWLAAVATHTALRYPERDEVARAFFSRREARVHGRYARETARYAAQAAARYPASAFWSARASPPAAALGDEDEGPVEKAAVQRAFERLKSQARLDLDLGPGIRVRPAPLVVEHEIVLADALHPERGAAVHFVSGLDATRLARLACRASEVGELYEAYNRQAPAVALGDFLHGLATLLASGLLHERTQTP